MIVAYVTQLGYMYCATCVAAGYETGTPVLHDANPHCSEPCSACGRIVNQPLAMLSARSESLA